MSNDVVLTPKGYYSSRVVIRDTDHFNRICDYMNNTYGKGKEFWTINGPVRKHLRYRIQGIPLVRRILVKADLPGAKSAGVFLTLRV